MSQDPKKYHKKIGARLKEVARLSLRPYFGGTSVCRGDVQLGMIMGTAVYLRVSDASREKYEEMGSKPFSYSTKRGRVFVRTYYEIPDAILKDSERLKSWLQEAASIARKIKIAKLEKSKQRKVR